MNGLSIQLMNESDVSACAKMIGATSLFEEYGYTAEKARQHLLQALSDPNSHLIVSKSSGSTTGFAWLLKQGAFGKSAYLRLIAVTNDSRSKGVGTKLLASLEQDYLKPYGLFLLVTETNTRARRFYENSGYRYIGTIPGYVKEGINECLYFKPPR